MKTETLWCSSLKTSYIDVLGHLGLHFLSWVSTVCFALLATRSHPLMSLSKLCADNIALAEAAFLVAQLAKSSQFEAKASDM